MELCMRMLAEKLQSFRPELHISWDDKPSIINVKFICQEKCAYKQEFVYVAKAEDVPETLSQDSRINLICIGRNASVNDLCNTASHNIIILDPHYDPFDVFDEVQSYFQFCNQWEKELQTSVMNGHGLQELIDLSDKVIVNPMFLLDSAFMALAWNKDIRADSIDDTWRSIAGEGHVNAELIKSTKNSELLSYLNSLIEPTFVHHQPHRAIIHNIRVNSKTVARVAVEEVHTALSESHLHFIKHLSKFILIVIQRDLSFQKTQGSLYDYFIVDQLEGKMHDDQIIRDYLRYQGWKITDSFCVVVVQGCEMDSSNNTLEYYGNLLTGMFSGSRSYLYEKNIVLIINEDKMSFSDHRFHSSLIEFFRYHNLKGGISASFNSFLNLHEHYQQASTALRLGTSLQKDQSLHLYKDYAVYHIIENCSKSMNLHLLCNPAVMKLYEYDREFHTDYFNSLYTYLKANKNLSDTAEMLGIHRNTAAYRINKIVSITDLNLKDESETPYILLSYKIVEYVKEFLTDNHHPALFLDMTKP